MAAASPLQWLDVAFALWLRTTVLTSLVVIVIFAARGALRRRLAPGARYGLWLLLGLPLIAPLLPAPTLPLPSILRKTSIQATPPAPDAQTTSTGWQVEYGPIPSAGVPMASPKAAAVPTSTPSLSGLRIGAIVWVAGVALLILRVAVMHVRALLQVRRSPAVEDIEASSLLRDCARAVGVRRPPRLIEAPAGTGPALLGVLQPRLLLPAGATGSLSREELRFVFLHELVHQKRGDVLAEWLLALLQIGHWFNPLIWLAASRCRADREIACDAAVLALTGDSDRRDYGRTILRLATEVLTSPRPRFAAAVGIIEYRTPLERRLRMIASITARRPARWPAVAVVLTTFAVVTCSNAQTADRPERAPAELTAAPPTADAANSSIPDATKAEAGVKNGSRQSATEPAPNVDREQLAALKKALTEAEETLFKKRIEYATRNDKARAYQELLVVEGHAKQLRIQYEAQAVEANKLGDTALSAKLDRSLGELSFDSVPLSDVVDNLRDVTGVNVFVNWKALEAAGINRNAPVTARMRNVQFSKALQVVLESAAGDSKRLSFKADRGVITISTADDLRAADESTTRVYDVRDLTWTVPNFSPGTLRNIDIQKESGPAADAAPPAEKLEAEVKAARQKNVEGVVKLIRETIEPNAWGKTAQLNEVEGQLIVTAPNRIHEPVAKLLEQLRETRWQQVTVETRFVSIDDGLLDALPAGLREAVAGELRATKDPVPVGNSKPEPAPPAADVAADRAKFTFLDEKQADQLMKAVHADKKSAVVSAPRITLFNGQWAYVLTLNQRAYLADYTILKQPDGGVKYEPVYGVANSGVVLSAQAVVSADRKAATVSLRPRLSFLEGMEELPWDRSPPGEKLKISRPKLQASELSTTANIADGQTLLMGGLKAYMGEDASKPGAKATPVLLLVKAKVLPPREVKQTVIPPINKP